MSKINRDKLIASFEEIIGWPYESPGTNDKNGIDCSGAFVRAYRLQGAGIYHGSNTIFRKHCSITGKIESAADFIPGMAVFKRRDDGGEPSNYRGDGHGNLYHIGLVCSIKPLRIIHATTPAAKADSKIGNWGYWGKLSDVDYGGAIEDTPAPDSGTVNPGSTDTGSESAIVTSGNGFPVKMRNKASTNCKLFWKIPVGAQVRVLERDNPSGWHKIRYDGRNGFMQAKFLSDSIDGTEDAQPPSSESEKRYYVTIYGLNQTEALELTALYDNAVINEE